MKVGIFGGTFNPPHIGHLVVAESVREQLQFGTILFIPSASPPNKPGTALAPARDRLKMTELAAHGNLAFQVSDIEVKRTGFSYTIDTIEELTRSHPKTAFSLIIGADNWVEFETWKSPREILARVDLVVLSRPGFTIDRVRHSFVKTVAIVNVPQIGVSGTDIRRRIKMRRSIRYLVSKEVEEYIYSRNLYRD